jgi:flagellar biosynthesis repressor protein FlbT
MALKVELKAGERIIVGDSVITNDDQRTRLIIDGEAPILREKDIMTVAAANTPCKKLYLLVQLMYLAREPGKHHDIYFGMANDIAVAAPSTVARIDVINNMILTGMFYKALKEARALIAYEQELLSNAARRSSLRPHIEDHGHTP